MTPVRSLFKLLEPFCTKTSPKTPSEAAQCLYSINELIIGLDSSHSFYHLFFKPQESLEMHAGKSINPLNLI